MEHFVLVELAPLAGSVSVDCLDRLQKGSAWFKLDEEIDIAVFIGVAARDRAEDAHILRAVLGSQM